MAKACKCIDRSHDNHKGKRCDCPPTTEDGYCDKCDFERHMPKTNDFIGPDPATQK